MALRQPPQRLPIIAANLQTTKDRKAQAIMEEMPIAQQVEWYLKRIRHTHPLPCSTEDLYFGCVPPSVKEWYDKGVFEVDGPLPGKTSNLLHTMFASFEKKSAFGMSTRDPNVLHVVVEEPEEYLEGIRGNRGYERLFWFRAPHHVPLPRNSLQTPFFLPTDHPHHAAIKKWEMEAHFVERELQTSLELATRYGAIIETHTQVYNTWPELLNFVRFKNTAKAPSKQVSQKLRDAAAKAMRPTDKDALLTQLARATMLPEDPPPLTAWVKFFTTEMGT